MQTNTVRVVGLEIAHLDSVPSLNNIRSTERNDLVLERLGADGHLLVINL